MAAAELNPGLVKPELGQETQTTDPVLGVKKEQPKDKQARLESAYRDLYVYMLVPRSRHIPNHPDVARRAMCAYSTIRCGLQINEPLLEGSALVHHARNIAVNKVEVQADWVLFCDDDMLPAPSTLIELIDVAERNKLNVVTANTVMRTLPVSYASRMVEVAASGSIRLRQLHSSQFKEAQAAGKEYINPVVCGAGFLLLRAKVMDTLLTACLDAWDWVWEHETAFTEMNLSRGVVEAQRLRISGRRWENYNRDRGHMMFRYPYTQDMVTMYGEDIGISLFMYYVGIECALAHDILVPHVGEMPYSPSLLGYDDWRAVRVPEPEAEQDPIEVGRELGDD